jgi:hypothetical protein
MTGWEPDNCHEEIKVYRIADRVRAAAGRDRGSGGGSLSQARRQRSHVLQLEEEVRRLGPGRVETVAAVGRREQPTEADRGGPDAGQAAAPGRVKKKL